MSCGRDETQRLANTLVGLTLAEAELVAKRAHLLVRIVEQDNQLFIGTCDYRQDRINVTVSKGKVTKVQVG